MSELELLLDDGRMEGTYAVERVVAPDRVAAVVDRGDLDDARSAIEDLCTTWGGACGALLPAERDDTDLPVRWDRFLKAGVFDRLAYRGIEPCFALGIERSRLRPRGCGQTWSGSSRRKPPLP
jgi:hypothetical protein